ncbi:hypothetical protein [Lysinibacillus fusiformis]|uniref:hypothetical protein n=1 Tax=Lysinibacillus fusiformis TaxID=28031 RepID=UPI003CFDA66C
MTLNPQRKIPDGVTVPFEGQTVDAAAAVLARQKAEREAAIERQNAKALKALDENPEPAWQRIASWLA